MQPLYLNRNAFIRTGILLAAMLTVYNGVPAGAQGNPSADKRPQQAAAGDGTDCQPIRLPEACNSGKPDTACYNAVIRQHRLTKVEWDTDMKYRVNNYFCRIRVRKIRKALPKEPDYNDRFIIYKSEEGIYRFGTNPDPAGNEIGVGYPAILIAGLLNQYSDCKFFTFYEVTQTARCSTKHDLIFQISGKYDIAEPFYNISAPPPTREEFEMVKSKLIRRKTEQGQK